MLKQIRGIAIAIFIFFFIVSSLAQSGSALWGITGSGGKYNGGSIFKTDAYGNDFSIQYSFLIQNEGAKPYASSLTQTSNGRIFGLTAEGGVYNNGVLFEFDTLNLKMSKKVDFDNLKIGKNPRGSLVQANNGKLYGMTFSGGIYDGGVIFEYDPILDTLIKKFDFDGVAKGKHPYGSLIQASNGKLYGLTNLGGQNNLGVLFEYDIVKDTVINHFSFNGNLKGSLPYGSLTQISNGNLYGMTKSGGSKNKGVLFEYDPIKDTLMNKFNFDGLNHGSNPYGSVVEDSVGMIYGMTSAGGSNAGGVLFKYNPIKDTVYKKIDFKGSNGFSPDGNLVVLGSKIYGQTFTGGTNSDGIIFVYDTASGVLTKKADFERIALGSGPNSMMLATNGLFYGLTITGGINDYGTLYKFNLNTNVLSNGCMLNSSESGIKPIGKMLRALNGLFYGMTTSGGLFNKGVIYEYNSKTNIFTKKIDFNGANGSTPTGSLIQTTEGRILGMTSRGGSLDYGVLFEYKPNLNSIDTLVNFDATTKGMYPMGSLMETPDGKIVGLTTQGGINNDGVLFEYNIALSEFRTRVEFNSTVSGNNPMGSLTLTTTGSIYGLTRDGGINNFGTLFSYDHQSHSLSKIIDFNGINGRYPEGSLMESMDGLLYGNTTFGGVATQGVIFSFNPQNEEIHKITEFSDLLGFFPDGDLIQSYTGVFYGMTTKGGTRALGTIFECDNANSAVSNKFNFDGLNGATPYRSSLIEICDLPLIINQPINIDTIAGEVGSFAINAIGNLLTFQWQVDTGQGFFSIQQTDSIMGVSSPYLSFTSIAANWNEYRFRCKITSACPAMTIYSDTVKMSVRMVTRLITATQELDVYPNPTTGLINLRNKNTLVDRITISDVMGRTILELNPLSQNVDIDLKNETEGIYFIKVFNKDGVRELKLIKE